MPDYSKYYDQIMQCHTVGFKLALGGTGLGKTNGVAEVCLAPQHEQRKSMYWANRIQLLEEMAQKLPKGTYVVVRRDFDMVRFTLANHREAFYQFVKEPFFASMLKQAAQRKLVGYNTDLVTFLQTCKQLESYTDDELRRYKKLKEDAESLASSIFRSFRFLLISLHRSGSTKLHEELLDHPVIRSLFPYIAFKRDSQIRILLMTLHKAYYGFFDGFKTLNMTRLKGHDGGFTIFLDEFDFLEHDLISMICRAPQIEDPFRFIDRFYQEMSRQRLPSEKYPFSDNVRNRIVLIMDMIEKLNTENLPFPNIYKFTSTIPERSIVFRTRHTISTTPLYLFPTQCSFHVVKSPHDPSLPQGTTASLATRLFNAVSQICARILMLFKELEEEDEIIYREVLRHCFESSVFLEQVPQITHFSHADQLRQRTQLGTLLETGYDIYDIKELQQQTDPEEVDVQYYSINLTPEKLLCSLAQHNLVFGLSATADIPRLIHHFHLDWLEQQQVRVLHIDGEDQAIIHNLNQEKASRRDNELRYRELQELDSSDPYQEKLIEFISSVAQHEEFGKDNGGHRKQRVQLFFATLLWLLQQPSTDPRIPEFDTRTCLLFLNSFQQIKLIFEHYQQMTEGLFYVKKLTHISDFDAYEITLQQQAVIVAFYNAQAGNRARQNKVGQQFNQLFWEKKPVVVVTQYLSAGNGVNLQYLPHPNDQKEYDFTSIGLLEVPYFYFRKRDESMAYDDWIAAKKENVWYQAKLYAGKAISEDTFRARLTTLEAPDDWSSRYQHDPSTGYDALLNNMATFMQALGRIERVWHAMPDQTVLLSKEVHQRFLAFVQEDYDHIREGRDAIISDNLRKLFLQVQQTRLQRRRDARKTRDATFAQKNTRCKLLIEPLLKRLEQLRQGQQDNDIRKIWQQLRQLALQHQFNDLLLRDYGCVAESPYYAQGKLYYTTPQQEIIPASVALPGTRCWEMNALYEVIAENPVIRDYFLLRGYELAFGTTTRQFFLPYFYQAILTGAIGEEAIVALLKKRGIMLDEIPDGLFELADLKIMGRPWYIDCKYYNEDTLESFSVPYGDLAWRPKLNDADFKKRAQEKLAKISDYHGQQGKLIYLNLVSRQDRPCSLYDRNLVPVTHLQQADIIVIQGVLKRAHPDDIHQVFTDVIAFLR
jgi:hypothetical protein